MFGEELVDFGGAVDGQAVTGLDDLDVLAPGIAAASARPVAGEAMRSSAAETTSVVWWQFA